MGQVRLSGTVSTTGGELLPGVNVFLVDTYDGASSDSQGNFEFVTKESGQQTFAATFVGYKEFRTDININDSDIVIKITLEEQINELQAVTINAGSFMASDASRRTVFRALDIATTAGATADIAGALNTLPGTQKVGESGRLFVRGGDGNETRTFIDGLVVLDAYSPAAPNTPSRGRFLPFMFKGMSFSTGGYSAEFGQALSSALVLDSRDKAELTRTDFGILSVGGDVGHTQAWDHGSIGGKLHYTNLRPYVGLITQEIDWDKAPVSMEGSVAFRHNVGRHGILKFYGNFNQSNFSLYQHDIDDYSKKDLFDLTNRYRYLNAFYKTRFSDDWTMRGGMSYSCLDDDKQIGHVRMADREHGFHIKSVVEGSISDYVEIKTGAEGIVRANDQTTSDPDLYYGSSFREAIASAFAEADIYASNRFVVRLGGRMEYNELIGKLSIDPRASLAYKVGNYGQTSVAFGKFRQTPKNQFILAHGEQPSEKSDHYILNYQYVRDKKTLRVEGYFKKYKDLIKYQDGDPNILNSDGNGYAKGIELFWRDNGSITNLDYWFTYSYLDTKRNYLDFPSAAVPTFASTHNLSLVAKYFVQKIKSQLGFTYSFASGRPYEDPNVTGYHVMRTPNYVDLSFNWSYLPSTSVIIYFSCTNLLGRDNVFGYEFSDAPQGNGTFNGRAIRQAAPRFLFLGIFITLSKDKSVNQLPNL